MKRDTMTPDANAPPLNPLPWVVWVLALPMIAMEAVLALGASGLAGGAQGIGWRMEAILRFSARPDYLRWMAETGAWSFEGASRLVTYPFVQGSTTQALFVVVILLALGKSVGETFRWWAVLAVFFLSSAVAAIGYAALPFVEMPLFGGYPGNYGLIGAFTWLVWTRLAGTGRTQYRAFTMIAFLMGAQLLFALVFGTGPWWIAELIGFATGFVLSFAVSPKGWAHLMARLRQR